MNIKEFVEKLSSVLSSVKITNPENIKVYLYNDVGECLGEVYDISLNIDIKEEDIPYDIHGLDPISEHDNVLIIKGE